MHRIDGPGATVDNKFTEGDPASAVPATTVTDDWLNAVQEEIIAVLTARGLTPNKAQNNQLLTAIQQMIAAAVPGAPPDAGELVKGVLKIATLSKIYEGLDDEAAVTSKKLAARLGGVLISGITMTAGAQVLLNHNLGVPPGKIEFTWVCVNAQNGWSPGEPIHGALANQSNPSSGATGMGVYWYGETSSQVTIGFGNGAWLGPVKGTGARAGVNLANFTLSARITA